MLIREIPNKSATDSILALKSIITVSKLQEDETTVTNPGSAEQLSVRERMQRFNRMASETDLPNRPSGGTTTPTKKRTEKVSDLLHLFSISLHAIGENKWK